MILRTDKRHSQGYIWNINTFVIGYRSRVFYSTDNIGIGDFFNGQSDQTVIDQDTVTWLHIVKKIGVSNGYSSRISFNLTCGKRESLTFFQNHFSFFEIFQTDLWTFGIQKGCNRFFCFISCTFQLQKTFFLFFMISVGKVKSCNVHTRIDEGFQNTRFIGRWTKSTDNFCFFHKDILAFL